MGPCGFLAGCYPPNGLPVRTLKIGVPKRNCYHPKSIFRGYVSFREGTYTPFRKLTWQAGKYHVFAIVIFYAHLLKSVLLFCFFLWVFVVVGVVILLFLGSLGLGFQQTKSHTKK